MDLGLPQPQQWQPTCPMHTPNSNRSSSGHSSPASTRSSSRSWSKSSDQFEPSQRKSNHKNSTRRKRSNESMRALRLKWLNQCFKYAGVPYNRKFHEDPSSPHHNAPLYLDCCGLVRQASADMEDDLGFKLGRWNQAYQYDTLRDGQVASFRELEPGDLVFIQGIQRCGGPCDAAELRPRHGHFQRAQHQSSCDVQYPSGRDSGLDYQAVQLSTTMYAPRSPF